MTVWDLYFDFINLRALAEAGINTLLIAPVSGGKSTLLKALAESFRDTDFTTLWCERWSVMRLYKAKKYIQNQKAVVLTDDFSTIGEDMQATWKILILATKLSYDKQYFDPLFNLDIQVEQYCHIVGAQPFWIKTLCTQYIFDTILAEKFIRYYRLPINIIKRALTQREAIEKLLKIFNEKTYELPKRYSHYVSQITEAFREQVGKTRGREYAKRITPILLKYVSERRRGWWINQFCKRITFEEHMLFREYEENAEYPTLDVRHREYQVLFFALQYNSPATDMLRQFFKIRSKKREVTARNVRYLIQLAKKAGFVTTIRKDRKTTLIPTRDFQLYSLHRWW